MTPAETHTARRSDYSAADVVALLARKTYAEVQAITGWSKGSIYSAALAAGARKTEARIQERRAERQQRQLEAFAAMLNTTAKADVLDFLESMPDESIQLVVSSPPYNIAKPYNGSPSADAMRPLFYLGWLAQVISECARVLKPGGVICFQVGSTRDWMGQLLPLDVAVFEYFRQCHLTFQNRVVWTVPHGLTPKQRLAERYETLLIFSKGEPTFNPNAARIPQKQPGKRAFKGPNQGKLSGNPLGAWPTNVWDDIGNVGHAHPDKEFGDHPAQFPLALAKRAILLYSMPGDVVCDVFSGSGTTQVGAIQTGRAFIGCDLFYEDLRAKRVGATQPDLVTPLTGITDASLAVWQAEARKVELPAVPRSLAEEQQQLVMELF